MSFLGSVFGYGDVTCAGNPQLYNTYTIPGKGNYIDSEVL